MKMSKWESVLRVRQETAGSGVRSDAVESMIADCKSERSRDDVYKRLGGQSIRYLMIIPGLLILMGIMIYLLGYYNYQPREIEVVKTETRIMREVWVISPIRKIPPAGATLHPKCNKGNHHLGVQRFH